MCLNLIDSCSGSSIHVFKSFIAVSHKLIWIFLWVDYVSTTISLFQKPKETRKMSPLHGRQKLISSPCSNFTRGRVCIPHATALLIARYLKETKADKEQQPQCIPNRVHGLTLFGRIPVTIFHCCQINVTSQSLIMRKNRSQNAGSEHRCQVTDLPQ